MQKTLEILVFSIAGVPMGVHWAPSQLPQFGRPKKKSRNRGVLQLFFRQLGLGWAQAGSATSKVKVLSRRNVSFFKTCCFACTGGLFSNVLRPMGPPPEPEALST